MNSLAIISIAGPIIAVGVIVTIFKIDKIKSQRKIINTNQNDNKTK